MSSPTMVVANDPHRQCIQAFKMGFLIGRDAGREDVRAQVLIAEMQADYWYFVAQNPGAVEDERKRNVSYLELWQARAEQAERQRWWDEMEHQRLDDARGMIAAGDDDLTIAVTLGLFLPMITGLRTGEL